MEGLFILRFVFKHFIFKPLFNLKPDHSTVLFAGVLDIPMISWVVMLVSRLLDYVATVEDEAATAKKPLNGKDRDRFLTGAVQNILNDNVCFCYPRANTVQRYYMLQLLFLSKAENSILSHFILFKFGSWIYVP